MIQSREEFARIWKKESAELSQLDYFSFKLINNIEKQLVDFYFIANGHSEEFLLNPSQISEMVVQLVDSLQFFIEQICFGNGCALGCPNKLNTPFSEMEDEVRLEIIEQEFKGNADACRSRRDCFKHDLMNYVIKDTLIDYYCYFAYRDYSEDNPELNNLAAFIVDVVIKFTLENGPVLLKEPHKIARQFS
jgi:hypothetical protein